MKYTDKEALGEILKRSETVSRRRKMRTYKNVASVGVVLFAGLVVMLTVFPPQVSAAYSTGTLYGAFLLSREAGGYVLAGVVTFVLGVIVTVCAYKYRKLKKTEEEILFFIQQKDVTEKKQNE